VRRTIKPFPFFRASEIGGVDVPHVIVKLWPGKSEQQKARLADKIAKDVMVLNSGEESILVAIEEVQPQDWAEQV
jgi:4-oxalocrotonate tautomerase